MIAKKLCYIVFLLTSNLFSQEDFNILIERQYIDDSCTLGYLSIDKEVICHTLELPWVDNQNYISSIPKGKYKGILRYDKSDGWRIQLKDVPNRSGIQIHIGNYTEEIKGCVLVGMSANIDDCSIGNSSEAYTKLKNIFYNTDNPILTPNKNITLTFK